MLLPRRVPPDYNLRRDSFLSGGGKAKLEIQQSYGDTSSSFYRVGRIEIENDKRKSRKAKLSPQIQQKIKNYRSCGQRKSEKTESASKSPRMKEFSREHKRQLYKQIMADPDDSPYIVPTHPELLHPMNIQQNKDSNPQGDTEPQPNRSPLIEMKLKAK